MTYPIKMMMEKAQLPVLITDIVLDYLVQDLATSELHARKPKQTTLNKTSITPS